MSLTGLPGLRELLTVGSLRDRLVEIAHDRAVSGSGVHGALERPDLDQPRGVVTLNDGYGWVDLDFDMARSLVEWIGQKSPSELVDERTIASPRDRGTESTSTALKRGEVIVISQSSAGETGEIVAHVDFLRQLAGWIERDGSLGLPRS